MFSSMKHLRTRRLGVVAAALASVSLAFAGCGDNPFVPLPEEGAPEVLQFATGGFGTGSRMVEMRGDTVLLVHLLWGDTSTPVDSVRVVPTVEDWRRFWASAEEAGVSRWRRRYVAEGIVDGSGWMLKIRAGGRTLESEGSNAYPDREGREHENEPTDAFLALEDAIADLIGQPMR